MTDDTVVIDEAGLARAWKRFPNTDVWLAFRPSPPGVEVVEVEVAVDAANAEADPDDDPMVEAQGP